LFTLQQETGTETSSDNTIKRKEITIFCWEDKNLPLQNLSAALSAADRFWKMEDVPRRIFDVSTVSLSFYPHRRDFL
jgi:hypothetical protein